MHDADAIRDIRATLARLRDKRAADEKDARHQPSVITDLWRLPLRAALR